MVAIVPTLDSNGWLSGVAEKADALFAYFLISDYSQSTIFQGRIKSLPWIIKTNPKDLISLTSEIQRALEDLYAPYFDTMSANVTIEKPEAFLNLTEAKIDLRISVIVRQGGRAYSLGRLINVVNNKIGKVTDFTKT